MLSQDRTSRCSDMGSVEKPSCSPKCSIISETSKVIKTKLDPTKSQRPASSFSSEAEIRNISPRLLVTLLANFPQLGEEGDPKEGGSKEMGCSPTT